MRLKALISVALWILSSHVAMWADTIPDVEETLQEVTVTARGSGLMKLRGTATNTDRISSAELRRAACCNLGESFTTNASVDVNYSDAATGAKQIKLLGLSGNYVQMLTENIPNLRGAGGSYGLGYIPGPWMESIQVSKGTSSVKNGYESITGQINVEFLKPQDDQSVRANGYVDLFGKAEINASGNLHLGEYWSTGLLLHGENGFASHDENDDGFIDLPRIRQFSGMNRWAYLGENYIFQAGIKYIDENRESGQHSHSVDVHSAGHEPYRIDVGTVRWEGFLKNAYIFDRDNEGNVALILSGIRHKEDGSYGERLYDVTEQNFYASAIFERKWADGLHGLSAGLSFNYDHFNQLYRLENNQSVTPSHLKEHEGVGGVYGQYTYNLGSKVLLMGGIRYDHSSVYGGMITPRGHVKLNLLDGSLSLFGSAGKGYHSPHALLENRFLLASSRKITIGSNLQQERAVNYGGGANGFFNLFGRKLNLSGEYYYTRFSHQLLVDLDSDGHGVTISDSEERPSYSHTVQLELSYDLTRDLLFTAAYRMTDVKVDYGNGLVEKPLTSRNKGLFTLSWTPMMGKWQADVTLAINGSGRMPSPYLKPDGELSWPTRYHTFPQLNAQLTKNFRHWSLYLGGENLTGYRQKNPIIDASNPWGDNFDATMVYAPIHGAMIYAGFRYTFTKY
ncbi:MAG: TonB-dependent receptor [Paramuribaculum sp.]|nr:TonB-dependent receptor [Paramuribaculum sp.]